ncbi:DedA family protein [Dactylosporangium sp. NPDC049742]|uniref:DedA family protein n=1 Tax=Dactylosporangium sp. NPDC049742 TaxID=3154737 RepID=UPI003447B4B1
MVDAVMDLVAAPGVLYATILVLLTVDAFVPVVPAQALMIGGGILSTTGHVQLLLLVAAGAVGAVSGDLLAFLLGRRLARRDAGTPDRMTRRKPRAITLRLNEAMRKHIFLAVLLCRFVPAGRMITAIYAGRNGVSTRRFASYDVLAATLWATYGALLGHFGGEAIADSSWLPLVLVAAAALLFLAGAPLLSFIGRLRRRSTPAPALALASSGFAVAGAPAAIPAGAADPAPQPPATGVVRPRRSFLGAGLAAKVGFVARAVRAAGGMPVVAAAPQPVRRRCRRSAVETLAAAEPLAAIEVLVAAEAVAAAESVVVQVNGYRTPADPPLGRFGSAAVMRATPCS